MNNPLTSNPKMARRITIGLIVLVLLGIIGGIHNYIAGQVGTVNIDYNLTTLSGVNVAFNGKAVKPISATSSTQNYKLHRGTYNVTIGLAGYRSFSTSFTLSTGQDLTVDPALSLTSDPSFTSLNQITGTQNSALTITAQTYFYNKIWAVSTVQLPGTDPAIIVTQYIPATQKWALRLGPGTDFPLKKVDSLPSQVRDFLKDNHYVTNGA